jgi:hypothetical protein
MSQDAQTTACCPTCGGVVRGRFHKPADIAAAVSLFPEYSSRLLAEAVGVSRMTIERARRVPPGTNVPPDAAYDVVDTRFCQWEKSRGTNVPREMDDDGVPADSELLQ